VDLSNDKTISKAFLRVFTRDRQDGAVVLATFAEWCGLNTLSSEEVKPELVALYFRILLMLGIKGSRDLRDLSDPKDFQTYIQESDLILTAARGLPEGATDGS